jgi:hypothetical protein
VILQQEIRVAEVIFADQLQLFELCGGCEHFREARDCTLEISPRSGNESRQIVEQRRTAEMLEITKCRHVLIKLTRSQRAVCPVPFEPRLVGRQSTTAAQSERHVLRCLYKEVLGHVNS